MIDCGIHPFSFLIDHQPFWMLDEDMPGTGRRRCAALPDRHDVDVGLHPQAFLMSGLDGDGQRIPAGILSDHVKLSFVQFDGPWINLGLVERRGLATNLQVYGIQPDRLRVLHDFPHGLG